MRTAAGIIFLLLAGVLQTPAQLSLRAASAEPVPGWARMELGNQAVWVSPTASLTSADIARAEAVSSPDAKRAVAVEFTDEGARKMRDLSGAQVDKLIALVLDGRLIWAPKVRDVMDKQALLTGNGPDGLPETLVQRILASVSRR
jgi:preprotein translocase subunit SecD